MVTAIAILVFLLISGGLIAGPLLYDYLYKRKQKRIRVAGLTEELEFIQNYKSSHEATGKYTNEYNWELYNGYKDNRICPYSCLSCAYWAELDDGCSLQFRKGICKLEYKQCHNAESSSTYYDWCCDYHSFNINNYRRKEK